MEDCPYAIFNVKGLTQWITCSKLNGEMCAYQRRCAIKNKVINSEGAINCKVRNNE
jgi:hypothetical protein